MHLLGMFVYIVRGLTSLPLIYLVFIPPELYAIMLSQRFSEKKKEKKKGIKQDVSRVAFANLCLVAGPLGMVSKLRGRLHETGWRGWPGCSVCQDLGTSVKHIKNHLRDWRLPGQHFLRSLTFASEQNGSPEDRFFSLSI